MAVLERPGEEHPAGSELLGEPLELAAVVAEADDHRARVERAERLEQQLDALVLDQLAEVDDGRAWAGARKRASRSAFPSSGRRGPGVAGVRRIARLPRASSPASASSAALRGELVDVDAGRHLDDRLDVGRRPRSSTAADVLGADEGRLGRLRAPRAPSARARGRPRIEYSSSEPCALTRKRPPTRGADGAAHQHVVGEERARPAAARGSPPRSPRRSGRAASALKSWSSRASSPA